MGTIRGVVIASAMLVATILIFARTAPPSVATPARVVATGIAQAERQVEKARAGDGIGASSVRGAPPSPLLAMIGAGGHPCDAIVAVAPIRAGDGIYGIVCRHGDGTVGRYRVDTRRNAVSLLDT